MDLKSSWERLLSCLERTIEPDLIRVWFEDVTPVSLQAGRLLLQARNRFYVDWIRDNYQATLEGCSAEVFGRPVQIAFRLFEEGADEPLVPAEPSVEVVSSAPRDSGLNTSHTFDTFVVGECNKLAHAAALAVVDHPARTYNPLYVYGPTGLGKTHLMHAIGNEIQRRQPSARVVYVTAEDFTNEMINSIRFQRTETFRERYRETATVLLVDDIQFLSGKQRTQEEFFHTFNRLQQAGRQIVITSDVEPKDIEGLEPRLRTRFEGGLVADMQPPDMETLLAILRRKADDADLRLPDDVALAIAEGAQGSIREVEGVILRLGVLTKIRREPVTLEFARRHLPRIFAPEPPTVTVVAVIEAVARVYNLRSADIIGQGRARTLTVPRHVAMFLARKHTKLSFPELGREFGNRDHSTIQHGVRRVEAALGGDHDLAYQIRLVEQHLGLRAR